ncbi:MarR family winged helix-turn-helix transcriptional regulator [Culicoidibacter larvae]|uniref:HTH-type transcriptional regulator SarZ n=1 Tax=Culicoidibacter larvae TaxID=2579976 RepID=A0A5R8QEC3_9FIRM|nr:MarR family winged helix-turn-helix transcriptional regulator [Culicoidibacter larvae]TLG75370.1 winged helix-turn-helix transcriptional regulator [Culicoidibacter larvae]
MKTKYSNKDQLNLDVFIKLSRCAQSVQRKIQKFFYQYNITVPQFGVLEMLYHKGDLCIQEVIDRTLSSSGNMTVVVENLRKEGYISKQQDKNDGRKMVLHLESKGHELMEILFPAFLIELDQLMMVLSEDEKVVLSELLKRLGHAQE